MQDKPENIELILPFGETLRGFTEQSFITHGDLKQLLRERGIFTVRAEKQDTIPIAMLCLLSPKEFDFLRECQNTKEDNPKIATQTIECESAENLMDSIPDSLNLNDLIQGEFVNYMVIGSPNFVIQNNDPNNIRLDFEIERKDLTKNWATTQSRFRGSLQLIRHRETKKIRIIMTNTASETKQVNHKLTRALTRHFKENSYISQRAELEKILFSSFTNTERIAFFLELTKDLSSSILEFNDIVDIEFCPENSHSLPERIKWMKQHINNLKLKGESLQETFFVKEKEYHRYLALYSVDAEFKFFLPEANGSCTFNFGFPNYAKNKEENIELEVNVSALTLDATVKHKNKNHFKEELLKEIDNAKIDIFEKHKRKL